MNYSDTNKLDMTHAMSSVNGCLSEMVLISDEHSIFNHEGLI